MFFVKQSEDWVEMVGELIRVRASATTVRAVDQDACLVEKPWPPPMFVTGSSVTANK